MDPTDSSQPPPVTAEKLRSVPTDIHIGTEKTGTTAIQSYLRLNRGSLLSGAGVLFPTSLGNRAASNLVAACQLNDELDDLRLTRSLLNHVDVRAYYQRLSEDFRTELEAVRPARLLLSSEHFSSRLRTREEIVLLRDFLQPYTSSFRILIYLRRQDEMLLSGYSTAIKNGRTAPFRYPPEGAEREDCHYDRLLDDWAAVFGEERISVRLYEQDRLYLSDVISDFCRTLDLPGDMPRAELEHNPSFATNMLEFIRGFNARVPKRLDGKLNPLRGHLVPALEGLDIPGEKFSGNTENHAFYRRFDECNRNVARRWFRQDDTVPPHLFSGTPTDTLPPEQCHLDYDQLLDVCARLWTFSQSQLRKAALQRDCLRAELLLERDQLEDARRKLDALGRDFPGEARPLFLLARLALKSGDREEALRAAHRAAAMDPDNELIARFIERAADSDSQAVTGETRG